MHKTRFLFVVLVTLALALYLAGCGKKTGEETTTTETQPAAGGGGTPYDPAKGTAAINGKVNFTGTPPEKVKINMSSEPACHAQHKETVYAQEGEVNANGTLPYVFVYVKEGADKWTYPVPTEAKTIDQKGCRYIPHVFGIQVNQPLEIINSDPNLHNIHSYTKENPPFNFGMPTAGMRIKKTLTKVDLPPQPIKCDVHTWMVAYMGVLNHPFYSVTGEDGTFSIKGLPPGDYTIEAWHERYGSKTEKVTVGDNQTKDVTFTFSG